MNGWSSLISDPVFQHTEGAVEDGDVKRLLGIIREKFYSQSVSVDINDRRWSILARPDTIGKKAEAVRKKLYEWIYNPPAESAESGSGQEQFLVDQEFRSYTLQLFEKLYKCVRNALPHEAQTDPYEARARATAQDNLQELADEVGKAAAARESAEDAKKAADTAKATAESIMPNMLTTLGVFVAIIIAVVACYLSLVLSNPFIQAAPGEAPKTLNIVMLLLMGHILLNIIFLLLYLISKMSAHPLSCHCLVGDHSDCQECAPGLRAQCRFRHKLWQRYPYVVAMNGAFVAAYCALGLWYLVRRYFGTAIDEALAATWQYAAIMIGVAAALIAAAAVFVFRFFLRSPQHKMAMEKKEQKVERERGEIRKLRKKLSGQEERITELERSLNLLTEQVERYQKEKDSAPVQ